MLQLSGMVTKKNLLDVVRKLVSHLELAGMSMALVDEHPCI